MAIKKISEFTSGTPTASDKILFEQSGAGKSATVGDVGKAIGINMDLLWTNASPTSTFASQSQSIDLSKYKFVYIIFRQFTSNSNYIGFLVKVDGSTNLISVGDDAFAYRLITVNTSGVTYTDASYCTEYASKVTNNSFAIPYQIYGVK